MSFRLDSSAYRLFFWALLWQSLLPLSMMAQSSRKLQQEASEAFKQENYEKALICYNKLLAQKEQDPILSYRVAYCQYRLSHYEAALPFFNRYLKYKKHEDIALFYTADALHHVGRWSDALRLYKLYLKISKTKSNDREAVKMRIRQCFWAGRAGQTQIPAMIISLGDSLNSPADELLVLQQERENDKLFFSSNRDKNKGFDIFSSTLVDGLWKKPQELSSRYNSAADELLLAFPDKGYQLLYQRAGIALIDNYLDGAEQALEVPFTGLSKEKSAWEGDHYFYSDSLLLFSAEKPEGLGGLDIYYSIRNSDGTWTPAQNIGPEINSIYDERCPFLAKDGLTIYLSSNRPQSLGAYDIYKSVFSQKDNSWQPLQHQGTPLSAAGDDLFFRPNSDGTRAYLSSDRNGGRGGLDLYQVFFRQPMPEQKATDNHFVALKRIAAANSLVNASIDSSKMTIVLLEPIYYDGQTGAWQGAAEKQISELAALLLRYPGIKLMLTAHSDNTQSLDNNLFFSVQQAEVMANMLLRQGIAANRIRLRGCAEQYPQAKNNRFDGSPDFTGRKLNNRIEIQLYHTESLPIKIEKKSTMISSVLKDTLAEDYGHSIEGLSYKVQLVSSPSLFAHAVLSQMGNAAAEKTPNNPNITFCIGMAKKFDAIKLVYETALEMGFSQAKVVPYIDGMPIDKNEAAQLLEKYPDLEKWIRQ